MIETIEQQSLLSVVRRTDSTLTTYSSLASLTRSCGNRINQQVGKMSNRKVQSISAQFGELQGLIKAMGDGQTGSVIELSCDLLQNRLLALADQIICKTHGGEDLLRAKAAVVLEYATETGDIVHDAARSLARETLIYLGAVPAKSGVIEACRGDLELV